MTIKQDITIYKNAYIHTYIPPERQQKGSQIQLRRSYKSQQECE